MTVYAQRSGSRARINSPPRPRYPPPPRCPVRHHPTRSARRAVVSYTYPLFSLATDTISEMGSPVYLCTVQPVLSSYGLSLIVFYPALRKSRMGESVEWYSETATRHRFRSTSTSRPSDFIGVITHSHHCVILSSRVEALPSPPSRYTIDHSIHASDLIITINLHSTLHLHSGRRSPNYPVLLLDHITTASLFVA